MIIGIGTDIIEIERIRKTIENTNFLTRFFSDIAGNFAAKEAFSKAIGTGFRDFKLEDISILRDSLGKPYIKLSGELSEKFGELKIHVSISHSEKYATSYVVIEEWIIEIFIFCS